MLKQPKLYNLMQAKYLYGLTDDAYKLLVQAAVRSHEWWLAQQYQVSLKSSTRNNKLTELLVEPVQT